MLGAEELFYVLNLLEFLGSTPVIETEQIQEHLEIPREMVILGRNLVSCGQLVGCPVTAYQGNQK